MSSERLVNFRPLLKALLVLVLCITSIQSSDESLNQLRNIKSYMNSTFDPCEDFYGYACGSYAQVMANSEYVEMLTTVQGNFLKTVQQILQTEYPAVHDLKRYKQNYTDKLQIYLHSCLVENGANLLHFLDVIKPAPDAEWPLFEEVEVYQSSSGWRERERWSSVNYNIFNLLGQLFSYGLNNDLIQYSKIDTDGVLHNGFDVPDLTDLNEQDVLDVLSQSGLPIEIIERYSREILDTHQNWQAIYQEHTQEELSAIEVSFGDLKNGAPELAAFLQALHHPQPIKSNEVFIIQHTSYFDYLVGLQWQPLEAEKLCNYLMIRFLIPLKDTIGVENCLSNANQRLNLAVNYVYYKHSYLPIAHEKNRRLSAMIKQLYKHFLILIKENRLSFNEHQMQEILKKLFNMPSNIGNLPENVTESKVEDFYRSMDDMDINNFYKNELILRKRTLWEDDNCPSEIICDNTLEGSPVNFPEPNFVMFPFAALEPPMYHSQYDDLMSLSLLGFITAHEFGHAIDPGSLSSETHFTTFNSNSTEQVGVRNAVECMKQQVPATEFVDERVADTVGVRVAYRAYSLEYGMQPSYTTIPWQQVFFLNLASFFCGTDDAVFEDHDADNVRLRHIAMNSEEFSQAFQCRSGSKMNPARKCRYI